MQSDQWHPSDIEGVASDAEPATPKRKVKLNDPMQTPAAEAPARRAGVMTLDRDAGTKPESDKATSQTADTQQRLAEAVQQCISCYAQWRSSPDGEADLTNALHEMRRVLARIEIELAASHGDENSHRPIPIPMHRAYRGEAR